MTPKTLYQKIWDSHVVREDPGQPSIIYIDRHLIHEGTSPQAFAGLRAEGRTPHLVWRGPDPAVSTTPPTLLLLKSEPKWRCDDSKKTCRAPAVRLFDMKTKSQGLLHIARPELGITQHRKSPSAPFPEP